MAKNKSAILTSKPSFDSLTRAAEGAQAPALVESAGNRAVELVEAWITEKNAAALLEVAEHDRSPAPARKAARRGLQVLKSRGVTIPEHRHVARLTVEETPKG